MRRTIVLAVLSNGTNVAADQGSDGGIAVRISWKEVGGASDEVVVQEGHLQSALDAVRDAVGEDALLVTRCATELRQVIHPQAAKEGFEPTAPFLRYTDISRLSPDVLPESGPALLAALEERAIAIGLDELEDSAEIIRLGVDPAICERTTRIEGDVVVRARGLPWQATDTHVALFFAGLNIAPGGVALCLSAEGRRNGEALVRFESPSQRVLGLRRHRHFLLSRYIEVYRANTDDFLHVAAGTSTEAVDFVSRGAAMIIRMRGLPFDTTEEQIRMFFAEVDCDVMEGGILFVNRADGRPTGDAFVLFSSEAIGQKALTRHRHTIGSRYVELFRSSQAEVQQVVKRSGENAPSGGRRDCVRLRGLPYEARVEHVVEFLGTNSSQIAPQGVHMVFNAQGHPSGEAFIQMSSETAAASVAASAHNKFMVIGKKQRYIEVFQCSPEDMNLMVAPARPLMPSAPLMPSPPTQPPLILPHPRMLHPNMPLPFGMYWPYPSPPVSPNMLLSTGGQILVTGLGPHVTPTDIAAHFQQSADSIVESVEMVRWPSPGVPGEAIVRIRPRMSPVDHLQSAVPTVPSGLPTVPHMSFPLIHT